MRARFGTPLPFGAHCVREQDAFNFALYSKHATAVSLLLFADADEVSPAHVISFDPDNNKTGRVWHCRVSGSVVRAAPFYAYQVEGPQEPSEGQRFDPAKVLLDPYARSVAFPERFSYRAALGPGSDYGHAPLGVVQLEPGERAPHHPIFREHDLIIYELHVRGFTANPNSGVSEQLRGTYAGLVEKIPYLIELGITAVELMPVFQFDPSDENFWGYAPIALFSPHAGYSSQPDAPVQEFRTMVSELRRAGLEVLLDVVYNHTGEGNEAGPTYSFKGLDNTSYYLLEPNRARYRNDTGCGNVLNTSNRYVRQLVLDSLRYWSEEMNVDGFRFDLASIFTRNFDGSINLEDPPIISEISSDPTLAERRLIAESWDLGAYQLGRSFPGISWLQWNGDYRDDIRRFVRGDSGVLGAVMCRLYGSDDLFPDTLRHRFKPFQSVNYVDCHDGFTLYDLVSYNHKHNEANRHNNQDGFENNLSWNCGHEGDNGVSSEVMQLRKRQAKNFFALLMLSNGTPMFRAGDEFLQTQYGNNNPYNQDNEVTWLDWGRLSTHRDIFEFFQAMIRFRKAHPSIGRGRFWRDDVRWYGPRGQLELTSESRAFAYYLDGGRESDDDLYVMLNLDSEAHTFIAQQDGPWRLEIDTAWEQHPGAHFPMPEVQADCALEPRSIRVLVRPRLKPAN